jgi:hypothetical protein
MAQDNLRLRLVGLKRAVNQKSVVRRAASRWERLSGPILSAMLSHAGYARFYAFDKNHNLLSSRFDFSRFHFSLSF